MNVWKLWLTLTRLVLTGRGRYEVDLYLEEYRQPGGHVHSEGAFEAIQSHRWTWVLRDVDWVGGEDRYVTLAGFALSDAEVNA